MADTYADVSRCQSIVSRDRDIFIELERLLDFCPVCRQEVCIRSCVMDTLRAVMLAMIHSALRFHEGSRGAAKSVSDRRVELRE